jgi:hyperosmotically inducible protein
MSTARTIALLILGVSACLAGCEDKNVATPTNGEVTPSAPAADNTARNKGDGSTETKTPMDQSESSSSIKITADIRRSIMDDNTMSMNAQNCKIITDSTGLVTLRGVVDSQAEKDSIESKAKAIAGATKVDNQLEVKTN